MKCLGGNYFWKHVIEAVRYSVPLSSFIGVFVTFFPFNNKPWIKVIVIASVFGISFTIVAFLLFSIKKRIICRCNNVSVSATYGDVFKMKQQKSKPVVIIPLAAYALDDCYVERGVVVDVNIASNRKLYEQWLIELTNNDRAKIQQIKNEIEKSYYSRDFVNDSLNNNEIGDNKQYRFGSSIQVEKNDITYVILPIYDRIDIKQADEKNTEDFSCIVCILLNEIERFQGRDVFVAMTYDYSYCWGVDPQQAFDILKAAIINRIGDLKSSIIIVVHNEYRDKVSFFL